MSGSKEKRDVTTTGNGERGTGSEERAQTKKMNKPCLFLFFVCVPQDSPSC